MGRLILFAPGVHIGGGLVILKELISKTNPETSFIYVDGRAIDIVQNTKKIPLYIIKNTVTGRIKAEYNLRNNYQIDDTLLCFHGLPPLFVNYGNIVVFEQNRLHIESSSLSKYSLKVRIRLHLERLFCRMLKSRVKQYVVQTKSMRNSLIEWHGGNPTTHIISIISYPDSIYIKDNTVENNKYDFVYVANGYSHKNHENLIRSWILLSRENIFPSLCLTIPSGNKQLLSYIDECVNNNKLRVVNIGELPHEKIWDLYKSSKALIFPSIVESFGLPLVEANKIGLPIIAAEKDYVRDICNPIETFDPKSPLSISRAIKRFFNLNDPPLPLRDASIMLNVIQTKK